MDKEKLLRLNIAGEIVDATPHNTSLFTFMGDLASRDHVFIHNREQQSGMYIFAFHTAFDSIKRHLIDNDYPLHVNMTEVSETDESAFQKGTAKTASEEAAECADTFPADWV